MCTGTICGFVTTAVGAILIITTSLVGYYFVPNIIEDRIIKQVVLLNDTIQMERFEEIPFPLRFSVHVFNISNPDEVVAGGIPVLQDIGPFVYDMYQLRVIESMEDDKLSYRRLLHNEFNSEASFPYTEDDILSVVNIPYHGVLQVAEGVVPGLMSMLNTALPGIFGDNNGPIVRTRIRDLLFDGITICQNPGIIGGLACGMIRNMVTDIQNMELQPDDSIKFSLFGYREGKPGSVHEVYRGINNPADLARIVSLNHEPQFDVWVGAGNSSEPQTVCNMLNGTDSGIFAPFVDTTKSLYAVNTDICRSVELRYERDVEYKGIVGTRFTANEWFLDNDDGCFCLNVTTGITENGCLLRGAIELKNCVGAYMVLSYPHFLYADTRYRNGVLGLNPIEEDHRIFLDLEPNTGTVMRGAKRAQFNVFMRNINGIPITGNLLTTLTPIIWIEEGFALPDEYADILTTQVVQTLGLVNVLVPVLVAISCAILVLGIIIFLCAKKKDVV